MANLLCKVHPDAKKSSAYVVVTEPTGSEGHPLPAVGGDPVVQACALMALQQAAHLAVIYSGTIARNRAPASKTGYQAESYFTYTYYIYYVI
jgi:hypothetical protein